jgi:hypothetical protein
MFRSGAQATVALVALAAAVYATASLSGGWLGTPPWWERWKPDPFHELSAAHLSGRTKLGVDQFFRHMESQMAAGRWRLTKTNDAVEVLVPRESREAVSASIALAGFALFAVAAWPRRDWPWRNEERAP